MDPKTVLDKQHTCEMVSSQGKSMNNSLTINGVLPHDIFQGESEDINQRLPNLMNQTELSTIQLVHIQCHRYVWLLEHLDHVVGYCNTDCKVDRWIKQLAY